MEHKSEAGSIISPDFLGIFINPRLLKPSPKSVRNELTSEGLLGSLPIELTINILLRLAFTDLLRLKCASKWACALISTPEFAHLQLRRSLESGSNSPILLFKDIAACYSIELDKVEKCDLASKFDHRQAHGIEIVGSCNGLICVRIGKNDAILYNPSTRDRHELPASLIDVPMPTPQGVDHICQPFKYGFGHDSASGDYKVLKICTFSSSCVMVYSLKNNSWRKVEPLPIHIEDLKSDYGVLCNETLHWVFEESNGPAANVGVIGFDLHSETYRQVSLPNCSSTLCDVTLGTLDGCLCASYYTDKFCFRTFLVWVMKEYGVKDSWTCLFKFAGNQQSITYMRPLAYTKSRDAVLVDICTTHLLWFDLRNQKIKSYVPCHHSGAVICLQSVVSPKTETLNVQAELQNVGGF